MEFCEDLLGAPVPCQPVQLDILTASRGGG